MKKMLAFILLFALIFLYSCGNNVSTTEETKAPDTYDTESTTGSTVTTSEPVKNKDDYSAIECKKISDYVNVNFSVGEDATALNMNIPRTWVLTKKSDSEYTIKCSGKNIGSVYLGIMTPENVETVYSDTQNKRNIIDSVYSIDKYENGDEVTFKRRISFTYTNEKKQKQSVTFNIDYAETDDTAFSRIRRIIQTTELKYLPEVGNIDLSEGNGKKSILENRRDIIRHLPAFLLYRSHIARICLRQNIYRRRLSYGNNRKRRIRYPFHVRILFGHRCGGFRENKSCL